jgi:flagellar basal body rod protein FlgC
MSELEILAAGAAGMERQRAMLDISARNVAGSQVSSPEHPYRRLVASIDEEGHVRARESGESADGLLEMVAMLQAQRSFESSASAFDAGKRLIDRTLEVGR